MSVIRTVPESEATGLVADIYHEEVDALGYVPSHTAAMALNPEALRAFEELARAVTAQMDLRRYELVTLAAAKAIGSHACRLAHGRRCLTFMDPDELVAVARDHHAAGLDELEVAIMDFATRVSTDSAAMTDADTQRLLDLGLSDREVVDVALAAALRNHYSRALHALAVEPDLPPELPEDLRAALVDEL